MNSELTRTPLPWRTLFCALTSLLTLVACEGHSGKDSPEPAGGLREIAGGGGGSESASGAGGRRASGDSAGSEAASGAAGSGGMSAGAAAEGAVGSGRAGDGGNTGSGANTGGESLAGGAGRVAGAGSGDTGGGPMATGGGAGAAAGRGGDSGGSGGATRGGASSGGASFGGASSGGNVATGGSLAAGTAGEATGGYGTDCAMTTEPSPEPGSGGAVGAAVLAPGEACADWGALRCNAPNSKQSLYCDSGTWLLVAECGQDENCDQTVGVCAPLLAGCVGEEPGHLYCDGDGVAECGPDRVTAIRTACCGVCQGGVCVVPSCGDGKIEAGEACDDGNRVAADGCEPDCRVSGVLSLALGRDHSCALLVGGLVRCWGGNEAGQLGLGDTAMHFDQLPYQLAPLDLGGEAVALDAGSEHTCALMADGTARCWGANGFGQLGIGHTSPIGASEPVSAATTTVDLDQAATAISAGGESTCALLTDGSVRCWGRNDKGQLGLGHTSTVQEPDANATVPLGELARDVATSGEQSCAVVDSNAVLCWGDAQALGTTENVGDDEPASDGYYNDFAIDAPFSAIEIGGVHACATVQGWDYHPCWGYNADAGLGLGTVSDFGAGLFSWGSQQALQLALGTRHFCVRLWDRTLRCWGWNAAAPLGIGSTDAKGAAQASPVDLGTNAVGTAAFATWVAAGDEHTCVLVDTGAVKCWGLNAQGQLGFGFASTLPTDYLGGTADEVPRLLPDVLVLP